MKRFLPILFFTGLLFGQDTLRTLSGQVVIGKYIETTDTHIIFHIDSQAEPSLIIIKFVKELTFGQSHQDSTFGQSHQDSTKVKNNSITVAGQLLELIQDSITVAGASIGLATGSSMYLLSRIMTIDGNLSFPEFIVMMLGPSVINGIITPSFLESENKTHLRTGMFLSSCATTIMPLLGPMFGAPNDAPSTVATIIFMGAIGGAFWNHRLALYSPKYREALKTAKFKRRKQSADS